MYISGLPVSSCLPRLLSTLVYHCFKKCLTTKCNCSLDSFRHVYFLDFYETKGNYTAPKKR